MNNIKKYDQLPVTIVEDHNEALPHIYRAMGSWHLPLRDVTLVHFDSHPDLLIPVDMPADVVQHKHQLFECLSIENWILPAVYAGHISHVVWIKPPWSDQIPNQTVDFYVGQCSKSATIKTSCSDNYFVSETLYVPESQLVNKQKLRLTVMTIRPSGWECSLPDEAGGGEGNCNTASSTNTESQIGPGRLDCTDCDTVASCGTITSTGRDIVVSTNSGTVTVTDCDVVASCGTIASTDCDTVASIDCDMVNGTEAGNTKFGVEESKDKAGNTSPPRAHYGTGLNIVNSEVCEPSPSKAELTSLSRVLDGQYWILDIDLDFFSTKNPFRELCGGEQYRLLQGIYRFEKPKSLSDEDLQYCSIQRSKQLSALKHVFSELEQNPDASIDHPSSALIKRLVSGVRGSSPGPVDWALVHEAGCTCDDTELPHHVSSDPEVAALVDAVQDYLSYLHKPTIITIARSSDDDYCPPSQVDTIQGAVLRLLQDLYQEVAVYTDYTDN